MDKLSTPDELETLLGLSIKQLRLQKNIDRRSLCAQAGVSETALRNLESGKGSTIKTLVRIVKSLGREPWFNVLAPETSINPLHMIRKKRQRQRASRKKHVKTK